jgi:pimeloyl-ACP methyl ester carboxylesterase
MAAQTLRQVTSRDGTRIAYETLGSGPVVILMCSDPSERSSLGQVAAVIARDVTVITFDRRGTGASGDTRPYAVDREIEDIEAVIDAEGGTAGSYATGDRPGMTRRLAGLGSRGASASRAALGWERPARRRPRPGSR